MLTILLRTPQLFCLITEGLLTIVYTSRRALCLSKKMAFGKDSFFGYFLQTSTWLINWFFLNPWPGLRIRSDIDRIRILPFRTNRIWIHAFFKDRIRIQTPLSWKFSIYFMIRIRAKTPDPDPQPCQWQYIWEERSVIEKFAHLKIKIKDRGGYRIMSGVGHFESAREFFFQRTTPNQQIGGGRHLLIAILINIDD